MRTRDAFLAVGISVLVLGALGAVGQPPKADPVAGYRSWKKINEKPIYMEPAVAASCIGPAWWDGAKDNPHVPKYFTVYVNKPAEKAMLGKSAASFPVGSVIVKEKCDVKDVKKPVLLTVMTKREPGFDKANGDWEYTVYDGSASHRSEGNKKACQSCHASQKDDDFVYRNYVRDYVLTNPKSLDRFKDLRLKG